MVFCNRMVKTEKIKEVIVTILILIDGFLQYEKNKVQEDYLSCHNPYFNRWFSAI